MGCCIYYEVSWHDVYIMMCTDDGPTWRAGARRAPGSGRSARHQGRQRRTRHAREVGTYHLYAQPATVLQYLKHVPINFLNIIFQGEKGEKGDAGPMGLPVSAPVFIQ